MLLLNKKDIEKSVDLDGMMDQIEEAYKIFESGAYYMPPRPTVEYDIKTPDLHAVSINAEGQFGDKNAYDLSENVRKS
ncbi:MAG: hypothetical protein ACLTKE_13895 [Coprococcus sp.]